MSSNILLGLRLNHLNVVSQIFSSPFYLNVSKFSFNTSITSSGCAGETVIGMEEFSLSTHNQSDDQNQVEQDELRNDNFEEYLHVQEMVKDEDEWNQLISTMRRPLPTSIRVNKSSFNLHLLVQEYLETKASSEWFVDSAGKQYLKKYPWYPEGLAYYFDRDSQLNKPNFGLFAKSSKFSGAIYFQEAVSMIPILALGVKSHHSILDMCASPGSKTTQALQFINSGLPSINTGCLIANDLVASRVEKLVVHAKHLCYPQLVITKGNASNFPPLQDDGSTSFYHKFDRILCDVPCSGDGTTRKNLAVWKIWDPIFFKRFHCLQLKMIKRGVTQLKKDGLIVYSTCSLNPVENEAVIASLINSSQGSLKLVDCHRLFPLLKCIPGLKKWKIMQPDGSIISKVDEISSDQVMESMFTPENTDSIGIEKCLRILPHHFDNGGFFVALIRKIDQVPWEHSLPYYRQAAEQSVKLKFLHPTDSDWLEIKETYRLRDDFPCDQLVQHSISENHKRIHFVTKDVKKLITENSDKLNIFHVGVGVFERVTFQKHQQFRLMSEGIPITIQYLPSDLIINVSLQRFHDLVLQGTEVNCAQEEEMISLENGSYVIQSAIRKCQHGSEAIVTLAVPILKLNGRVVRFITHAEKVNYLRLCGFLHDSNSANNLSR